MFKMGLHDLNKEKLKEFIKSTDKPIRYTYGFAYRNPTIHKILVDKDMACNIADKESFLDVEEFKEYVHMNAYSVNDML